MLFYRKIEEEGLRNVDLKCWQEASTLCQTVGGYLPIFHSRTQLEDFLALMKSDRWMVHIEAIYIGLQFSAKVDIFETTNCTHLVNEYNNFIKFD